MSRRAARLRRIRFALRLPHATQLLLGATFDPGVYLRVQNIEGERSISQDFIVECAQIEFVGLAFGGLTGAILKFQAGRVCKRALGRATRCSGPLRFGHSARPMAV